MRELQLGITFSIAQAGLVGVVGQACMGAPPARETHKCNCTPRAWIEGACA